MTRRFNALHSVAATALMLGLAGHAVSQEQAGEASAQAQSEEVIQVTGTRVTRSGFDAPTPTRVITAEELASRGTAQVGEFLVEVPAFRGTQTPQTNPQSARGAGQYFADLRALGSIRTLTLVDGRRHVPSSPDGQVDLNLIPSVLISRVDVVTGGASAQWGSDAVAGVVNIIMNRDLEGARADFSYGISDYGDMEEWRASLAYGTAFAEGRGSLVVGAEFVDNSGIASHYDRPYGAEIQELASYTGARPAGEPSRFWARGVTPLTMTSGGVIIGANTGPGQPLRGIQFGPGGTVLPFNYGQQIGSAAINNTGGEPGFSIRSGHTLVLPVERRVATAYADFELSPSLTVFGEASYARAGSDFTTAFARDAAPTAIVIQRANPFIPTAVTNIMDANGITQFAIGREHRDFGPVLASNFNTTYRFSAGLFGQFENGWTWDAYAQHGQNEFDSVIDNLKIMQNLRFAFDAISDGAGGAQCRSATARADGCVAINLFGFGSPSQAAIDYVTGTALYNIETTQQVFAFNLQGEPFSTWAGPVSVATGLERRTEESISRVDPISEANGFAYGNPKSFAGEYTVNEGYLEFVAPLLNNSPLAQNLDLNAAARYADYSSSGGVWTWKVGLTWDINDQIRLRTTRSRDIRAPNNSELFAETSSQTTLRNPFSGATTQMSVVTGSSPTLQPETADTFTVGAVFSPSVMPGLRMSVDYFDIDISGAISGYSPQLILDNCLSEINGGGAGFFCSFVTRTGTGAGTVINRIDAQLLNIAGFQSRGIDFEVSYQFGFLGGEAQARLVGTYMMDLISDDGLGTPRTYNAAGVITNVGSVVDRAGQVGGFTSSSIINSTSAPEWTWSATLNYRRDRWGAMIQGRYVGGGNLDNTLVGPDSADYDPASPISIADNTIDSRFYINTSATFDLNDQVQLYGVINNVGDVLPPFPYTGSPGFHDRVGRAYKVGVRVAF